MQKLAIVVTGFPGAGSTSLCENLITKFGLPRHYYAGRVVRWLTVLCEARGRESVLDMTPEEIMWAMESGREATQQNIARAYRNFPPELDRLVDLVQQSLLEKKTFGVHEGRMAPHLVYRLRQEGKALDKKFITILCTVDPTIGAKRHQRKEENKGKSVAKIMKENSDRVSDEEARYKTLYGIQKHLSPEHFDIVVDTTPFSKDETCVEVLKQIENIHPGLLASYLPRD